jgi:CubicO group peptidase (beta-lactamase class C family)
MIDSNLLASSPESVGIDPSALEALFERAEKEVREGILPSVQIAVAREGKIAGMRSFGRARFGGREADADDDSLYCIFSCTKAITSAAAWLLIQEGKLSVDEQVAAIVPEFGSNGKDAVRVEQLFTHTAGFPTAPFDPTVFLDRDQRLAYFARWRLNFAPGSRFIYHPSSSMYVIAEIIERRSGLSYHEFVRGRIAEPLGLPDLFVGLPDEEHARAADIEHRGDELTDADFEKLGFPKPPVTEVTEEAVQGFNRAEVRRAGIPGGGAFTNAHTLALFYQGLLSGGRTADGAPTPPIWKPETVAMAREIRNPEFTDIVFGKRANRGLGLMIAGDKDRTYRGFGHTNSDAAFGHGGAGGQIGWADPVTGISVGYCTNGFDRHVIRQARRGVGISSRAAACAIG